MGEAAKSRSAALLPGINKPCESRRRPSRHSMTLGSGPSGQALAGERLQKRIAELNADAKALTLRRFRGTADTERFSLRNDL